MNDQRGAITGCAIGLAIGLALWALIIGAAKIAFAVIGH